MRSRSTRFPFHNHKVANRIGACTPIDVFEENVGNGALLPTIQANHLREGLTDYLATTFALTDPDAQSALSDFVGHPDTGMFKGPYVRLRLPFAPAGGNWSMHLDWWPTGFIPYGHQGAAFERLSTKFHNRPQPTLVTTGTGSGKTEAFLYPILEHVLRSKAAGVTG